PLDALGAAGQHRYPIEAMAPPGVDLLAGARRDPVFGPVVLLGLGGVVAEALADVAVALAPLSEAEAAGLADRLAGRALLDGFRGGPVADRAALGARLGRLGLRPGMRIVVQLPNCWPFVVLTLACLRAGIVPVMALPAHRRHELAYLCEHSEARALAVPDMLRGFDHQQLAEDLLAASQTLEHVLVVGQDVRHQDLTALCAEGEAIPPDP